MAAASAGVLKPGIAPTATVVNAVQKSAHQNSPTQQIFSQKVYKKQIPQRITYISKNVDGFNNTQRLGTIVSLPYSSTSSISASHTQQQLLNKNNQINIKQIYSKGPNVSKGWRRLIIKGDIVYISPSGEALTSLENVKEYLLKNGTCKCGLPCPLRPELFFDFDVQIPNLSLKLVNDNGEPLTYSCSHVRDDSILITRRKITKERIQIPQSSLNSIAPPKLNIVNPNSSVKIKTIKQPISEITLTNASTVNVDNKLSNLKLTRSPPWSKNTYSRQLNCEIIRGNQDRVPPLPPQHVMQQKHILQNQTVTTNQSFDDNKVTKVLKSFSNSTNNKNKRKPNFKDDPTGYLEQQTAILQNSILSVPSPDINEHTNINSTRTPNLPMNNNTVQIFNSSPHQMIEINQNSSPNFLAQSTSFPIQSNQILIQQNENDQVLPQNNQPTNQIISNLPHSTTFCGQTVTHMPNGVVQIQQQQQHPQQVQSQTSIHSIPTDITVQQQIQLQQQIQQQNQLIRQTEQQLQHTNNFVIQEQPSVIQNNVKSEENPVSSSTTNSNQMQEKDCVSPDTSKGPVQGGTISTSNDSNSSNSSSPVVNTNESSSSYSLSGFISSETASKNTITSVLAGRNNTLTATTSVNPSNFNTARLAYGEQFTDGSYGNKTILQNVIPVSNPIQGIQMQQLNRDNSTPGSSNNNQFIMTTNGHIILMPNKTSHQGSSSTQQVIINNSVNTSQFPIDSHNIQNNVHIISPQNVIQPQQQTQHNQQTTKHTFNSFNNVILSPNTPSGNNQNLSNNIINPSQQQTVLLNALPSSFVIQPNFVDGNHQVIINQGNNNNNNNFVQQQIQVSPDGKRRPKKRKNCDTSPQSPNTIQVTPQQNQSMLQITTPQYSQQNFQLSPSLPGITIIPNQHPKNTPQQQIIMSHQNGQIIQPINLIGQQLLVPAGLVVAPETTLLQIQNCAPIITQQGMMLRAPSPQNKSFISSNTNGQFIMNSNGQVSPIGQIYSTPVGLVVPHTNSGQTFVHQNTTIVQQQTTMVNSNSSSNKTLIETNQDLSNVGHSVSTQTAQNQQVVTTLPPPDTTTHSPRSPERPTSSRSSGSDQLNIAMVQCVSSSEPDSVVSPFGEHGKSPSELTEPNNGGTSFIQNKFSTSETKIRRIENSSIVTTGRQTTIENVHETSSLSTNTLNHQTSNAVPSFSVGNLVWGSVKGYPAWPGKIINAPVNNSSEVTGSAWVKWFGRKPNIELIPIKDLKSLSEGLDAHHKAQKDIRKSRKLNSQLENAIQEAMSELDRMSSGTAKQKVTSSGRNTKSRKFSNQQRNKPVKIAPAPSMNLN